MSKVPGLIVLCLVMPVVAGCRSTSRRCCPPARTACCAPQFVMAAPVVATPVAAAPGWDGEAAGVATKLEVTVDWDGRPQETEFHIDPATVPAAVQAAMDARHPGGPYIGAEKEWNNGLLYFELARDIGGFEVEAMFLPDGTFYEAEVQVPADQVPDAVRSAVAAKWPSGTVKAWEKIVVTSGSIKEYHVKLTDGTRALKVVVTPTGQVLRGYREVPAEIEVPISIPQ